MVNEQGSLMFSTLEEANTIAQQLGSIGGGVVDTYIPEYIGPYTSPDPDGPGPLAAYAFRFRNGADGINVGLIRAIMQSEPVMWVARVGTEIHAARKWDIPGLVEAPAPQPPPPDVKYCPIDFSRPPIQANVWASSPDDKEPIGARWTVKGKTYVKEQFGSMFVSFRAWRLLP